LIFDTYLILRLKVIVSAKWNHVFFLQSSYHNPRVNRNGSRKFHDAAFCKTSPLQKHSEFVRWNKNISCETLSFTFPSRMIVTDFVNSFGTWYLFHTKSL
jgi:hypothetical protein